ncbi:PilZ domain-containing protein [Desulfopila aestuarii]|uniref:PilZ domain-containing protein n=1 Tax=Desulfopila aestuarii DSM 18488 TaxID=1121416 RepID=A0A1M7YFN2_9BACT|nr:PilZ domain-containing protein [Desulfopila aestuarii]SHO51318.1 PilZ domain-containing protein [Desulfopila aestuarii DSM 18488]
MALMVAEHTEVTRNISIFFPGGCFPQDGDFSSGDASEYLTEKSEILPYLQTLLFEERLVGVQIEHQTRHFYTSLVDELPDLVQLNDVISVDPDHEPGAYLKKLSHINLAPLEPVAGNLLIRQSKFMVLEFYTGTTSVELGTFFIKIAQKRGEQVVQCAFPILARITRNARPFRAKTHKDYQSFIKILIGPREFLQQEFSLIDLSARGLAFGSDVPLEAISMGSRLKVAVDCRSSEPIEVNAVVRHLARARKHNKATYVCGIEFDLETRALAAMIEQKFTVLQRTFIRALREETEGLGVELKL